MQNDELEPGKDFADKAFDESIEDAVKRIVAQNPAKHDTTVEQREKVARAQALRNADIDLADRAYMERVREIGGDPDEMMVGNKPRYTMDEFRAVKDHLEGKTYPEVQPQLPGEPDAA